jgi:hypothetical protein
LALAALFLVAAAPGFAEPAAVDPQTFPADALIPTDEARQLFELLETAGDAAERLAAAPPEATAAMDAVIEQILAPGELVPGWQNAGVDLRPILSARDGGASASMATAAGPVDPLLIYFSDEPVDAVVSPGWILLARHGQPFDAEEVRIEISRQSPKVILVERVGYRRLGNALCSERSESRLYSDPGIAASEADMSGVFMTLRLAGTLDRRSVCHLVEEREPGVFIARYFDAGGHRLPAFDAMSLPFRIVARAPLPARSDRP